ncbi:GNAT family N-acetyltransferase [Salipaludibacillus neizhouensis]|uniref:GNAT family N-acetyltransferase n=1 Tax=Salipaludibacillus neizhouensis TaxID=885475 RepID=A0A3A9KIN8_9BACI|nr:GNAT family N-acetyltransferase [Salipaludibacillus neizhouensis]RKL64746.1 GNAT family N-acetyltransferase [Salipaludibacillus neizhouensis]
MFNIRISTLEDMPSIAKVHVESWRTTYKGIVDSQFIENLTYEWSEKRHLNVLSNKDMFIYVVEDKQGNIIGFTSGGPERTNDPLYDGELHAIYLLDEYQGLGLGRKLFTAVTRRLREDGFNSLIVLVLENNISAREFYKSLGGKEVREGMLELKGQKYKDIAYGWTEIASLI